MQKGEARAASEDRERALSRREFSAASAAAGLALTSAGSGALAATAAAQRAVDIKTPDGVTDAVLVYGQGAGPKPAVIIYPDAYGLRPVMIDMAKRLVGEGYAVLVVNQFYRTRRAPVFPPTFKVSNSEDRAELMRLVGGLEHAAVTRDATAFVAFLDSQPEVDKKAKIGAVGFCMGGSMTIRAAAAAPERVAAGASFHGGALTTEDPNSPHRLIARTKAAYHIGVAADDDEKDPQSKATLKAALEAAGRPHTLEVYPGANHGWMVPGSAAYNEAQAERGWSAMLALYKKALA